MEWVKRIEHLNVRGFCAQGIVGVGAIIPMFIASLRLAVYRRITRSGFAPGGNTSLFRKQFSARSSAASSSQR
jgi:hypothetical protein